MSLFESTIRPTEDLFYHRNDPNDRRLGEAVTFAPAAYDAAQLVVLGSPQDEGVRRNGGRPGAAEAPQAIRERLYRLAAAGWPAGLLFDLGDVPPAPTLEATHAAQREVARHVLADGKRLIVLGGGNDISYPDCAALTDTAAQVMACNIDQHLDIRADDVPNSGTPYRQLLDEALIEPKRFFEVGYQRASNSRTYLDWLRQTGAELYSLAQVSELGIGSVLRHMLQAEADAIFWGLDMDSVRAADAPGTSAPSPVGLSAADILTVAQLAGRDERSRLFEITEVNPQHDVDGRTARLAALAVWHFIDAVVG